MFPESPKRFGPTLRRKPTCDSIPSLPLDGGSGHITGNRGKMEMKQSPMTGTRTRDGKQLHPVATGCPPPQPNYTVLHQKWNKKQQILRYQKVKAITNLIKWLSEGENKLLIDWCVTCISTRHTKLHKLSQCRPFLLLFLFIFSISKTNVLVAVFNPAYVG